jgi:hypothetical protein
MFQIKFVDIYTDNLLYEETFCKTRCFPANLYATPKLHGKQHCATNRKSSLTTCSTNSLIWNLVIKHIELSRFTDESTETRRWMDIKPVITLRKKFIMITLCLQKRQFNENSRREVHEKGVNILKYKKDGITSSFRFTSGMDMYNKTT